MLISSFFVPSRHDPCMPIYPDVRLRRVDMHLCLCVMSARERNECRSLSHQLCARTLPKRQLPLLHQGSLSHRRAIEAHKAFSVASENSQSYVRHAPQPGVSPLFDVCRNLFVCDLRLLSVFIFLFCALVLRNSVSGDAPLEIQQQYMEQHAALWCCEDPIHCRSSPAASCSHPRS